MLLYVSRRRIELYQKELFPVRGLLSRVKSLLTGGARTRTRVGRTFGATSEQLEQARRTIARKNERLEKLRHQMARKDQEIVRLRASLGAGERARVLGVKPENIVWVFGTAKTGSSWLGSLMSDPLMHYAWREPNVGDLFGTHYYGKAEGKYSTRRNKHWEHFWILGNGHRDTWINSIRSFILEGARARFPEMAETNYLIIKEPHGSVGAPLLLEALPESRVVFLVRDPRDVAASALSAREKGSWLYERNHDLFGGEETLGDVSPNEIVRERAAMYVRDVGKVKLAYEAHEGYKTLVRYENLRADTLGVMNHLYHALGMSVDEDELVRTVERYSFESIPENKRGPGMSRRKATPGGWEEDLTPEQVKIVEDTTAPLLHEYYGATGRESQRGYRL
jgi:hypothetical protein